MASLARALKSAGELVNLSHCHRASPAHKPQRCPTCPPISAIQPPRVRSRLPASFPSCRYASSSTIPGRSASTSALDPQLREQLREKVAGQITWQTMEEQRRRLYAHRSKKSRSILLYSAGCVSPPLSLVVPRLQIVMIGVSADKCIALRIKAD